ncbi:MAG: pyridoxamine 5'-phosphate oxidase family protein [Candidatus Lokiarchaeota archaeon]
MTENEIENILNEQNICRIAFIDDEYPYISPFQYVYTNHRLFFHFTDYGKKMKILENNKNVCVSIEKFDPNLSEFYFVSIQGILKPIINKIEKYKVVDKMVERLRKKYSKNFLSAHGIDKEKGWEGFKRSEPLKIYFLEEKKSRIALKSKY